MEDLRSCSYPPAQGRHYICPLLVNAAAIGLLIGLLGCASVAVRKVPSAKRNDTVGLRFYRPTPYLVVSEAASTTNEAKQPASSQNTQGGLQFSIVWMPDLSEEYVVDAKPGLGSVEFNPTLENGWNLTSLNSKVDSKAAELLTAVAALIPKVAAAHGEKPTTIRPGMYRFEFERDQSSPNYGQLKSADFEHPIFVIQ